jgi:hypothetical protein
MLLLHMLMLLKVYLRAVCFTHDWNVVHKITTCSCWSEILIFAIFRKKLVQKSSVFIKQLVSNNVVSHLLTLLKGHLRAMCFTYVWNSVHKITKYSSWSEILIFAIFRKKLAQKSSVFVKLLISYIVVTYVNSIKSLFVYNAFYV